MGGGGQKRGRQNWGASFGFLLKVRKGHLAPKKHYTPKEGHPPERFNPLDQNLLGLLLTFLLVGGRDVVAEAPHFSKQTQEGNIVSVVPLFFLLHGRNAQPRTGTKHWSLDRSHQAIFPCKLTWNPCKAPPPPPKKKKKKQQRRSLCKEMLSTLSRHHAHLEGLRLPAYIGAFQKGGPLLATRSKP